MLTNYCYDRTIGAPILAEYFFYTVIVIHSVWVGELLLRQ